MNRSTSLLLSAAFVVAFTKMECHAFQTNPLGAIGLPRTLPKQNTKPSAGSTAMFMATQSPPPSSQIETNGIKDPSTLLSAQDDRTQQLGFLAIFSSVILGSMGFIALYDQLEILLPPSIFQPFYTILPYVLSTAFLAAGTSHFAIEDTFVAFVPPKGSWGGLWQAPAPFSETLGLSYAEYHNRWSGLAEIAASISLIATTSHLAELGPYPAMAMYLLTGAVTPANIYMYTHDPVVPRIPALPYPWGHVGRGVLQMALLGVFFKLAVHSM
mmetsp:Transcript_4200/g.10697  ORF Transcript_4200/g.10697 Transcript_4200/m.10697 type:complete len:270 (-) Transcript_4200:417-1226(-)